MQRPRALTVLLCLLAFLAPATARAQETVRLPGAHWTFTIPPGWERIPDLALKAQNDIVASRAPGKTDFYVLGAWRKDNPHIYVLIQPYANDRMNAMTFEDIERVFGAESVAKAQDQLKSSFSDVVASSTFGQPRLDRDRKRVIITLAMTDAQGTATRGVTQGLLWAGGMLNVHAYAPADQFDAKLPELVALADNVAFDAGQTFEPGSKRRAGIGGGAAGGAIGAVLAVALARRHQKRKQAAAAAQPAA